MTNPITHWRVKPVNRCPDCGGPLVRSDGVSRCPICDYTHVERTRCGLPSQAVECVDESAGASCFRCADGLRADRRLPLLRQGVLV